MVWTKLPRGKIQIHQLTQTAFEEDPAAAGLLRLRGMPVQFRRCPQRDAGGSTSILAVA